MSRILEYGLIFVVLILLQVFLFDNLNLSIYLYIMVYVGFILVLPMNINPTLLLLLCFATGVTMDFFTGTYGLHTIASLATGFVRPLVLNITVGKDVVRDGGMPLPLSVGRGKWIKYAVLLIAVHCLVFFLFEAMTFRYLWFTLARAAGSILSTTIIIWFLAYLFPYGRHSR